MAHTGHIIIPDPDFTVKYWDRIDDEQHPSKVWKRPWLSPPKTKGKVLEVTNHAVVTLKGFKAYTPLQIAVLALDDAVQGNYDQIRIKSPYKYGRAALKATADKVYNVQDLLPMVRNSIFSPKVNRNTVKVNGNANHPLAGRWQLSDGGQFAKAA